jgi:RND family efflux transporter MFP subunit
MLALTLSLASCSGGHQEKQGPAEAGVPATVMTIAADTIPELYLTAGTVIAKNRVDVASRVMGYIRSIRAREGQTVTKGELLVRIDASDVRAHLHEAEANLAQAKARAEEAKTDYDRFNALRAQQAVTEREYQQIALKYQIAEKGLHAARAGLAQARAQVQYVDITAPISGVVVAKHKDNGDMANPGEPILAIEDPSQLVLQTYVKEQQINHIHLGDIVMAEVRALHTTIQGHIAQIVPAGDATTHSYLVKAALTAVPGLKSGMFASVRFAVGTTRGIMIPKAAIISPSDIPGVYMVAQDNSVHFRMIRTGRVWNGRVEILSGLRPGERIVIATATPLHSGERIAPSPAR